jgi:hypothetical protein
MDTALALDPFEIAMANLAAAGIDFEVVDDPDPPDKRKPPPDESEGDPQGKRSDASSSETIGETTDRSEVRTVGEWQRALRDADLTPTEQHIGLMLSTWMNFSVDDGRRVDTAFGRDRSLSQATIAEKSGRSEDTVGRAIAGLEQKGYLYVHRRPGDTSIYAATVPTGATVHPLPTPRTRGGPPPAPEGDHPPHQRGTAYYSEDTDKAAAEPSLTEPTEEEVGSRTLELALAEVRRQKEAGTHVKSEHGLAKTIEHRFRDQARSELTNELRRAAIADCSECDANGFIDVDDSTRARCSHRRTA